MPGKCIRNGENREILANKAPLYDENGEIRGLVGFFIDREQLDQHDSRGGDTKRRDLMTGLLNSRGLMEEEAAFRDEFYLRNMDFVRIHVTIDDFSALTRQQGFEFGDKAMIALGRALKAEFGQTSAVARYSGQRFVILHQVSSTEEPKRLRERIKAVAAGLQSIDGVPLTLYLSVGYCLFSEVEDLAAQKKRAENSLLVDHDENASLERRISHASQLFHLYDNLPIPFAVYKVITNEDGLVRVAVIFYVNRSFEANSGLTAQELLGHSTRELFPSMGEDWYEKAARAALCAESVTDRFFFPPTNSFYHVTASQVIHPGYCCFTYIVVDLDGLTGEK
jgi:diguanylate cyclase (GGDEF)-like protein